MFVIMLLRAYRKFKLVRRIVKFLMRKHRVSR